MKAFAFLQHDNVSPNGRPWLVLDPQDEYGVDEEPCGVVSAQTYVVLIQHMSKNWLSLKDQEHMRRCCAISIQKRRRATNVALFVTFKKKMRFQTGLVCCGFVPTFHSHPSAIASTRAIDNYVRLSVSTSGQSILASALFSVSCVTNHHNLPLPSPTVITCRCHLPNPCLLKKISSFHHAIIFHTWFDPTCSFVVIHSNMLLGSDSHQTFSFARCSTFPSILHPSDCYLFASIRDWCGTYSGTIRCH